MESPESAKYDNYVTYTGKYTVHVITVIEKTIEEFFTLCPGLLLLADLVFRLYYIVSQVAMPFLFIKIPKSDTKQSITERKSD